MRSWIDRALADNDVGEINCQKGPKADVRDSTSNESTAKRGQNTLSAPFGSEIATEHFSQEQAGALITEACSAGFILTIEGGGLRVRHRTNANPDEALIARLADHKPAIIAELRRQADLLKYAAEKLSVNTDAPITMAAPTLSQRGMMCRVCLRVDRCYADVEGVICPACAEWEVRGCPGFAVLTTADTELEMNYGACLRCGASWSMHGNPDTDSWTRYADLDDVVPAATRFVLARAREIARGTRQ